LQLENIIVLAMDTASFTFFKERGLDTYLCEVPDPLFPVPTGSSDQILYEKTQR
jgi:hypothetical protein